MARITPDNTRVRLLEAAIRELAVNGSEYFRAAEVCKSEFVARSLLNHHFGSQLDLIAEATVTAYDRYVHLLCTEALSGTTPRERLERWMKAQAQWTRANPGIAVQLHFPHPTFAARLSEKFDSRMKDLFQYNLSVLGTLVKGVRQQELIPLDFDVDNAPFDELGSDMSLFLHTSSVGLSSLGASVWAAGTGSPSHHVTEYFLNEAVLTQHAKWVSSFIATTS